MIADSSTPKNPTLDNYPLSGTNDWLVVSSSAVNCSGIKASTVADYLRRTLSENTLRAYRSDLEHFITWGGTIPADEHLIAAYLAAHGHTNCVATLVRRVSSISVAHDTRGVSNPTRSPLVKATLRGIKRTRGTAQTQAKPLIKEDLVQVLGAMGSGIQDIRDRAILLIGFTGGFRRSELVALDRKDIEPVRQGLVIHLRRSKTDQHGAGRKVGIPIGRSSWCPVRALEAWLRAGHITNGAVFRPIDRHGNVRAQRLSGEAVSLVVKTRVAAAGYDAVRYSGHSLRAGFVTSAAEAGISSWKIRQQTGHRSDAMLDRYIRDIRLFTRNVAGLL